MNYSTISNYSVLLTRDGSCDYPKNVITIVTKNSKPSTNAKFRSFFMSEIKVFSPKT